MLLWINDGLMAVFFFRIGLELKYELREGRLRRLADVVLPGLGAVGGMALPALFYVGVVAAFGQRELMAGWAIPCATDIAFALGVLALAGTGLPPSLKTFLLTLAILDDIGAILIIAVFYGHGLHLEWLAAALVPLAGLIALNFSGIRRLGPAILLSIVLWVMVLESGIHATIAGVVAAFFIPLKAHDDSSPLHILDHMLAPYVTFLIVPVFALANAGVVLPGISALSDPLSRRHRRGPGAGQAARRDGGGALGHEDRHRALACRRDRGADVGPRRPRWHRLHHVAVHRRPQLRRRPADERGAAGRAVGVGDLGAGGIWVVALADWPARGERSIEEAWTAVWH